MAEVVLFIAASLDGLIARSNGAVDWLFTDQDYGYRDFFASIDTVIMGRKTYTQILQWGDYPYQGKQGFVFTRSPSPTQDDNVEFVQENIEALMASLRSRTGQNIWLVGGAELIALFRQQQWIDQLILSIHPLILETGIPLFLPVVGQVQQLIFQQMQVFETGLIQTTYSFSSES